MGYSIESLLRLKDNGFVVDDKQEQYRLALGLLSCLASLDTRLRDEISFDALLK